MNMQWRSLAAMSIAAMVVWSSPGQAATALPDRWRKTMTNDPESNYWLRKFSEPEPDQMVSVVRNIMLFHILSVDCKNVRSNKKKFDSYVQASGFFSLEKETAIDASRQGSALFDGFDYESLAHLCAGADYLFGSRGVLVKNVMSQGTGELAIPYRPDPGNPYLTVRPIFAE